MNKQELIEELEYLEFATDSLGSVQKQQTDHRLTKSILVMSVLPDNSQPISVDWLRLR